MKLAVLSMLFGVGYLVTLALGGGEAGLGIACFVLTIAMIVQTADRSGAGSEPPTS